MLNFVFLLALDHSSTYTAGVLVVDGGMKGSVPALTFDLFDRDSVSQSNTRPFKLYKTQQKQSNNSNTITEYRIMQYSK